MSINRVQKKELELIKKKQIEQEEKDMEEIWIILDKNGVKRKSRHGEMPEHQIGFELVKREKVRQ